METRVSLRYFVSYCRFILIIFLYFDTNQVSIVTPSPALITPSPAQIFSLPDYKFSSRLAPRVPNSILRYPPLCSFVSFSTVLVTPFSNSPESLRDLTIFRMYFIFSFCCCCSRP